jgi:hypothetical protein
MIEIINDRLNAGRRMGRWGRWSSNENALHSQILVELKSGGVTMHSGEKSCHLMRSLISATGMMEHKSSSPFQPTCCALHELPEEVQRTKWLPRTEMQQGLHISGGPARRETEKPSIGESRRGFVQPGKSTTREYASKFLHM